MRDVASLIALAVFYVSVNMLAIAMYVYRVMPWWVILFTMMASICYIIIKFTEWNLLEENNEETLSDEN